MPDVALIILAAGNSSRLGQAKQLRVFAGKTLLEHAVDAGLASHCSPIVVVLGSQYEQMRSLLQHKSVDPIQNKNWTEGMGSSIATAIRHLDQTRPVLKAVVIATCDQPFLSAQIIDSLIQKHEQEPNNSIVASAYAGINGVPAFFTVERIADLRELNGVEGARKIIKRHEDKLSVVEFPEGAHDIDTESDWQAFLQQVQVKS